MKIFRLGMIIVILIGFACNSKPTERYFRQTGSGRDGYFGLYEISKEDAGRLTCYKILYDKKGKAKSVEYLKLGKLSPMRNSYAAKIILTDSVGVEIVKFVDKYGYPCANWCGIYSEYRVLDKDGKTAVSTDYDEFDSLMVNCLGFGKARDYYDDKGFAVRTQVLDNAGAPTISKIGICDIRNTFDSIGNLIEMANYDLDGNLLLIKKLGAIGRYKYNEIGEVIENSYFGTDGGFVTDSIREYPVERPEYDSLGNETGLALMDSISRIRQKELYDEDHNLIELRSYGLDENLESDSLTGIAMVKFKYDMYGIRTETAFFGADEKPINQKITGVAVIKIKIDRPYQYESYYDTSGKLQEDKTLGIAKITTRYNDRNQVVEENYFDTRGRPKENVDGVALIRFEYDESGRKSEERYYGANNHLKTHIGNRAAIIKFTYDSELKLEKIIGYDSESNFIFEKYIQRGSGDPGDSLRLNEH
jgi:hypothetical protein